MRVGIGDARGNGCTAPATADAPEADASGAVALHAVTDATGNSFEEVTVTSSVALFAVEATSEQRPVEKLGFPVDNVTGSSDDVIAAGLST